MLLGVLSELLASLTVPRLITESACMRHTLHTVNYLFVRVFLHVVAVRRAASPAGSPENGARAGDEVCLLSRSAFGLHVC